MAPCSVGCKGPPLVGATTNDYQPTLVGSLNDGERVMQHLLDVAQLHVTRVERFGVIVTMRQQRRLRIADSVHDEEPTQVQLGLVRLCDGFVCPMSHDTYAAFRSLSPSRVVIEEQRHS